MWLLQKEGSDAGAAAAAAAAAAPVSVALGSAPSSAKAANGVPDLMDLLGEEGRRWRWGWGERKIERLREEEAHVALWGFL